MKVALVSYNWGEICLRLTGGLTRHATVHLALARQQADPHIGLLDPAIRYHPFDKPRLRQPLRQLATLRRIVNEIKAFDPDVVHVQHGHLWFNAALPMLRRYPLVITVHDPVHHVGDEASRRTPQAVYTYGFRRADEVIVQTPQMAREVERRIGLDAARVHVVPHGQLGDEDAAADVAEVDGTVLFFGRIWEYKGLEHLIRAEPSITERCPHAKIVIAGKGEDFGRYRAMMADPARFVVHNEWISVDRRAELFRRASVVVLPYIEATQSGIIPLASTLATPVVATDVGGLPDQVDDGRTGLLVPPRDEQALATAIVRLLDDRELRRRMGEAARQKARDEWSSEAVARQTLAVYQHAVERFASTTAEPQRSAR